jgi:hypothetical protein
MIERQVIAWRLTERKGRKLARVTRLCEQSDLRAFARGRAREPADGAQPHAGDSRERRVRAALGPAPAFSRVMGLVPILSLLSGLELACGVGWGRVVAALRGFLQNRADGSRQSLWQRSAQMCKSGELGFPSTLPPSHSYTSA